MSTDHAAATFVRIVELPPVKMARSGRGTLEAFNTWWSSIDKQDKYSLFPRDFMWFNPQLNSLEWLYALPAGVTDTGGYEVFDFPGGLYAVAVCKDNDQDSEATSKLIHQWLAQSDVFEELSSETGETTLYEMGRVTTPHNAKEMLGYHQMEMYVPLTTKKRQP